MSPSRRDVPQARRRGGLMHSYIPEGCPYVTAEVAERLHILMNYYLIYYTDADNKRTL